MAAIILLPGASQRFLRGRIDYRQTAASLVPLLEAGHAKEAARRWRDHIARIDLAMRKKRVAPEVRAEVIQEHTNLVRFEIIALRHHMARARAAEGGGHDH